MEADRQRSDTHHASQNEICHGVVRHLPLLSNPLSLSDNA